MIWQLLAAAAVLLFSFEILIMLEPHNPGGNLITCHCHCVFSVLFSLLHYFTTQNVLYFVLHNSPLHPTTLRCVCATQLPLLSSSSSSSQSKAHYQRNAATVRYIHERSDR